MLKRNNKYNKFYARTKWLNTRIKYILKKNSPQTNKYMENVEWRCYGKELLTCRILRGNPRSSLAVDTTYSLRRRLALPGFHLSQRAKNGNSQRLIFWMYVSGVLCNVSVKEYQQLIHTYQHFFQYDLQWEFHIITVINFILLPWTLASLSSQHQIS